MNWTRAVLLAAFYAVVLGVAALFLLVEPDEETFLGRLAIYLFYSLPEKTEKMLRRVLPRRVFDFGFGIWDYVFNKKNPLLQLFYLCIVLGGYASFVLYAHPLLPNRYLGSVHKYISGLLITVCLASFVLASTKSPGVVTESNVAMYEACYENDGLLYEAGRTCETCEVKKPARSKHCRLCGHCVPRFDHHCPWVNGCVGQENLPYFLLFLATHVGMLWYASVIISLMFWSVIVENDLFNATFYSGRSGESFKATPDLVAKYLVFRHGILFGLGILCVVMAAVLTGFLGYHVYLNAINKTTNETYKWSEIRRIHKKLQAQYKAYCESPPPDQKSTPDEASSAAVQVQAPPSPTAGEADLPPGQAASETAARKQRPPPRDPGEMPTNMYDKGVLSNLMEAWYPLTWRAPSETVDGKAKKPARGNRRKKKKA